jgi:hypothetical protein
VQPEPGSTTKSRSARQQELPQLRQGQTRVARRVAAVEVLGLKRFSVELPKANDGKSPIAVID